MESLTKSELIGSIRVHLKMNYFDNSQSQNIITITKEQLELFTKFLENEIPEQLSVASNRVSTKE